MKILGKKRVDKDFLEISVSQFISITGGVIAGIGLLSFIDKLVLIPGLLIMLPGFLEMHGNISGSLAARISVLLHTKKIKPRGPNHLIKENVNASIFLFIITSIILGLLAFVVTYFLFGVIEYNLLYIIFFRYNNVVNFDTITIARSPIIPFNAGIMIITGVNIIILSFIDSRLNPPIELIIDAIIKIFILSFIINFMPSFIVILRLPMITRLCLLYLQLLLYKDPLYHLVHSHA